MDLNIETIAIKHYQPVHVVIIAQDDKVGKMMALSHFLPEFAKSRMACRHVTDWLGTRLFLMAMNIRTREEMDLMQEFLGQNWTHYEYLKMIPICVREDNDVPGPCPTGFCQCNTCKPPHHKMVSVMGPNGELISTIAVPENKLCGENMPSGMCLLGDGRHDGNEMEELRNSWKTEETNEYAGK